MTREMLEARIWKEIAGISALQMQSAHKHIDATWITAGVDAILSAVDNYVADNGPATRLAAERRAVLAEAIGFADHYQPKDES